MKDEHTDNVSAFNVKGKVVFVDDVESGAKGYFCMGCKREMQAVKSKLANRRSYFRHVVNSEANGGKCTYSDETYRHKLAKEYLQRHKKIKVPKLYKYPPRKEDGWPNLLAKEQFIEAHAVGIELYFYEDEAGNICSGCKSEMGKRHLLLRPDVTFFDRDNNPILFIELVATHKVSEEKKIKLKRLGIDAVEVLIPRDSEESIYNSLKTSQYTKWLYNYDQEIANYIPFPYGDSEGIPPIDELQRELFEETYKCRSAQIRNLISGIRKCVGSESYREIKYSIREEISRVERNTEAHSDRWDEIQERRRGEVRKDFTGKEEEFRAEEAGFREYSEGVGERYFRKRKLLEYEDAKLDAAELTRDRSEEEVDGIIRDTQSAIGVLRDEQWRIEQPSQYLEREERRYREDVAKKEAETELEIRRIEKLREGVEKERERIERQIREIEAEEREFNTEYQRELEGAREQKTQELKGRSERIIQDIKAGKDRVDERFAKQFNEFYDAMAVLPLLKSVYSEEERVGSAIEAIRSGAYKNWHE